MMKHQQIVFLETETHLKDKEIWGFATLLLLAYD